MNPIYMFLVYFVWFLSTYFVVLMLLILLSSRETIFEGRKLSSLSIKPLISIIIPAFNEEKTIADSIRSLKNLKYEKLEFVIVNDGSTDRTSEIVKKNIKNDSRFLFIDNDINKGKSACLNQGIQASKGKFVATMDADSIIEEQIFQKVLPYFEDESVGAVTVSVKVHKPKSFLHKIIDLEYILGLSLFLKLFSKFNCVFVTPGPFSIYRKEMFDVIGGFDENNITEDLEIAYRIHKNGYKIENCIEASVNTVIPHNFKGLYTQRKRWYTGAIRTCLQHKDVLFNRKYGYFGFFIPFNFILITLGLLLFIFSIYLGFSKFLQNLWYFQYTGFNFLDHLFNYEFDILSFGTTWFLSLSSIISVVILMIIGLKFARVRLKDKKLGMLGYPFLFFLYQLFWLVSYVNAFKNGNVKWR